MRLGGWLLSKGKITEEQLARSLQDQSFFGGRLGSSLIKLGYINEDVLGEYLADISGIPYAPPERMENIPPEVIATVPSRLAPQYHIIPIGRDGRRLQLAMRDPRDLIAIDEIAFLTGLTIEPFVATEFRILQALERYYQVSIGTKTIPVAEGEAEASRPESRVPPPLAAPEPEIGLDGRPLDDPSAAEDLLAQTDDGLPAYLLDPEVSIPSSMQAWRMAQQDIPTELPPVQHPLAPVQAVAPPAVESPPAASLDAAPEPPPMQSGAAAPATLAAAAEEAAPVTVETPLTMEALSERLRAAETRDEVFDALLDFASGRFTRSALFAVQQERILGWSGRGEGISPLRIRNITVALDEPSLFVFFRKGGDYYYGAVPDLPANVRFYLDMGCPVPDRVLLMPVTIKGRPTVILYADNGSFAAAAPDIDAFRRALHKASLALEILILKNKIMML